MKNPDHTYVKLGKDNIAGFKDLLPHYFGDEPEKDVIVIGVMVGDTRCAAMMLRKDNGRKIMKVEHIFVLPEYRRLGIGKKLILAARDTAETGGFHGLEMRYYWGDPEVPAGFLISTGLKYNRIAAVTYELSRPVLGSFLRNDPDARHMKDMLRKEGADKDIRSLSEMPERIKKEYTELHPVEELSSMTLTGDKVEACIIISRYEDMFFMSDIYSDKTEDMLSALLFRSTALVFMNMREDETLVFTGYKQSYRDLLSYLFDPVVDYGVKRTVMMVAGTGMAKVT